MIRCTGASSWLGVVPEIKEYGRATMDYQTLRFEIAEGIATITLDQKDNPANTLDARMAEEVFEVSLRCGAP